MINQSKLSNKEFSAIHKALNPHSSGELVNAVNARDIHSFLGVGRDFSNWMKQRIKKYGFVENIDYIVVAQNGEVTNQSLTTNVGNLIEYHLSPDMTKQLAMVENNDKGMAVRLYYIDLEKKAIAKIQSDKTRSELRGDYRPMTNAIAEFHAGKESKFYHYSNECDMLNRIILGCTSAKFRKENDISDSDYVRDYLTMEQKLAMVALQRANTVYLEEGLDFEERKAKLTALFNRKYHDRLIAETHRLCA